MEQSVIQEENVEIHQIRCLRRLLSRQNSRRFDVRTHYYINILLVLLYLHHFSQLGGTFVIDGMRVVFEYMEKFAGDHVSPGTLLEYLGATDEMYASLKLETPKAKKKIAKLNDKINKLQAAINMLDSNTNAASAMDSHTEEGSFTEKDAKTSAYTQTKVDRYKKRLAQYVERRDEILKKSQSTVLGIGNNNNK